MVDVLFQITKDQLETGLRGFPCGYCITSTVDPQKGLFYTTKPVSELTQWSPEQVIYLLYQGKQGTPEEVAAFSNMLVSRGSCCESLLRHIRLLPREGHPMKLFCSAILLCGIFEGTGDYKEDCLNLIAKIPEIAATVINHHAGWEGQPHSQPELGYMENFTRMIRVPGRNKEHLNEVFRLFNILHYDHGGGNLSTFVGKAVASGLEDMYGSIAAAMAALAGPRHGKANQDSLKFVSEALSDLGDKATPQEVETFVRNRLSNKELIFGFGHAILRVEDPRATVFYDLCMKKFKDHPLVKMALLIRSEGVKVLSENPKISDPYPNIDAISGTVLSAAGFPYPEYFTVLFGVSRTVGIAIQIVYERCQARNGKGTPIVRPKYLFKDRNAS